MKYEENQIVDILRSVRHDLLNQVQLLKANLSLKRLDRVELIIDEIVAKAKTEAQLSNLQVPRTTLFLLGYNWKPQPFKLEIALSGAMTDWSEYDEALYLLLSRVFTVFEKNSDHMSNNVLSLSLFTDFDFPRLSFKYLGKITDEKDLDQYFSELNQTYHLVEKYIHSEETVITFELTDPLR